MSIRVKIFGAGSIGNHLAQASRRAGWEVVVCDIDQKALTRMREDIYPKRYGEWDDKIKLYTVNEAPVGEFDAVFIGTPPDARMEVAQKVITQDKPRLILLEKPAFPPFTEAIPELIKAAESNKVMLCVGFDHILGQNTVEAEKILKENGIGKAETLDVEFREHWGGIFLAHPWLAGPQDSYLGFWKRGGGASSENSHATNLWQHFSHFIGGGRISTVSSLLKFVSNNVVDYDNLFALNVTTENGLVGRIIQDVVTKPAKKWARVQGSDGFVEWHVGHTKDTDMVRYQIKDKNIQEIPITKKRPDDFFTEINHIGNILNGLIPINESPIRFERGFDTWLIITAAHLSFQNKRTVMIDYGAGYNSKKAFKFI